MKKKAVKLIHGRRSKRPLPIAKFKPFDVLDNPQLICGPDGVVRCKDGRKIDEYINDPRNVFRRKNHELMPRTFEMTILDIEYVRSLVLHQQYGA